MLGENEIYRICKDKMFCHNINNPQRFMREYDHPDCEFDLVFNYEGYTFEMRLYRKDIDD